MCIYRPNSRREGEFEWLNTLQGSQLESQGQKTFKKKNQTAPTSPHVVWEGFKKNYPRSSKNKLQHIQLSDTNGTSNGTGFYGQMKQRNELFSSKHSIWVWCSRTKSTPCVQWHTLLYCWCCGAIFLLEVLDILFRCMASWILSNIKEINKWLTVRNLIMGHVWIFQPDNNPNTNLKNITKMGHWAQNQASAMSIPVLWPEPCRTWVRWTEEKMLWIWRIWSDSGWRNGLWYLVMCSLTSSVLIEEHLERLKWKFQKVLNKRAQLIVANVY